MPDFRDADPHIERMREQEEREDEQRRLLTRADAAIDTMLAKYAYLDTLVSPALQRALTTSKGFDVLSGMSRPLTNIERLIQLQSDSFIERLTNMQSASRIQGLIGSMSVENLQRMQSSLASLGATNSYISALDAGKLGALERRLESASGIERLSSVFAERARREADVYADVQTFSQEAAGIVADETESLLADAPEREEGAPTARRLVLASTALVSRVIAELAERPEMRYELDDRLFEEIVAEMFSRHGFEVELTQKSRDGGRDVIATKTDFTGRVKTLVECKRYAEDNPVTVQIVRQLHGVVTGTNGGTNGLVVSTSRFTKPALGFVEENSNRLATTNGEQLIQWIRDQLASRNALN